MPLSRSPAIKRKTSNMSILCPSRSPSVAPSMCSRPLTPSSTTPSTPRSIRRYTSGGLRHLFRKHRAREPEFEILSLSSPPLLSKSLPPRISRLAKAFVNSLNAQQLSNFLTWMLFHELVELPEHPDVWYSLADSVHMHGWIALGEFLSKCSTSMDTSYGFDLVVLDSICDRLQLQRSTAHSFLIQFAHPEKMAFSQIATLVNAANAEGHTELEVLEAVQSKLLEFSKMAAAIKPTEGSIYDDWHTMVMKRLDAFIQFVIGPRIAHLCSGAPLITASTSKQLPQVVKDSIKLKYLYEVVQQKRPVPLSRYGIQRPEPPSIGLTTPPSSPPDAQGAPTPDLSDAERARNYAIHLMIDNCDLRAQVAALEEDKEKLQESNDKLACKVATLGRIQPSTYVQPPKHDNRSSSVPGAKLAAELDQQLNITPFGHTRHRSKVLSWKYEDVFDALDSPPSPPIRLSNPAIGELLQPSPVAANQCRSQAVTYGSGAGRRSGMIFSADQKDLLRAIREATPSPPPEANEEGCGVSTPTPSERQLK